MQKPSELKKPLQPGSLRKEQLCPGCGRLTLHAPGCTWTIAADQLRPKKPVGS